MKMKRKFGLATLAATLAGTGIMGGLMATPVLADPPNQSTDVIPYFSENEDPNLAITKCIPTGKGTDISSIAVDRTFTFKFEYMPSQTVVDGGGSQSQVPDHTSAASGPAIADKSVTINPGTASTAAGSGVNGGNNGAAATTTLKTSDATTDYYKAETADWLQASAWNSAATGVHVYKVTETSYTPAFTNKTLDQVAVGEYAETLEQSKAEYRVYVYVRAKEQGTGNYVYAVTVAKVKDDAGNPIDDDKIKKDDPLSGTQGELSDFEFNNTFTRQLKTGDSPIEKPYSVYKQVIGLADNNTSPNGLKNNEVLFGTTDDTTPNSTWARERGAKADKFKFDIKLTRAAQDTATSYNAYIYTTKDNSTWNKGTTPITFTFDANGVAEVKDIELCHYQALAFEDDLAVGTLYEVTEHDYKTTAHSNSGYEYTPYIGSPTNSSSVTDSGSVVDSDVKAKSVYFNDAEAGTTPMGILTNYLPFFIIIGGAIAGAVAIAVAKGKKRGNTVQ